MIRIWRVYDPPLPRDGSIYLVDRFWPRGIKREAMHLAAWAREAAPSPELCRWFGHVPEKWEEFQRRYTDELDQKSAAWQPLLEAARHGSLILFYGARDREHNNAVALKSYLERRLKEP